MGPITSCCPRAIRKDLSQDDRAATLRAGGRIRVVRNETEDPRAPLLTKKREDGDKLTLAPDLDSFVADLQSASDDFEDEDDEALLTNY
jgi:hypothetical protein